MAKVTIYVPDDLKVEMDAAEEPQPNWSALAQEVFRQECSRIATRKKGIGKMETVIERLRASKERSENAEKSEGFAAGRAWAMEEADFATLKALTACKPGPQEEVAYAVASIALFDNNPSVRDVLLFWEQVAGTDSPSEAFADAFLEGALEIFHEVEDKI